MIGASARRRSVPATSAGVSGICIWLERDFAIDLVQIEDAAIPTKIGLRLLCCLAPKRAGAVKQLLPVRHLLIALRYADGIGGLVKCAGEALKIPLKIMADIRDFEARRDPQRRKFHVGQRVRITGGPFSLFEGKIERLDRAYRLSVLIDFLGAIRSIELDEDEVEAG